MLEDAIRARVERFYQKFPYPAYPLLAPLRWQDGFTGASLFAAALARGQGMLPALDHAPQPNILLAGAGEALPYILRKLEPADHHLTAVDLSARSLQRAKVRLSLDLRPIAFKASDLSIFLDGSKTDFVHIDSYGVLHHLAHPSRVIGELAEKLKPGGTCRFMVYNTPARRWIIHLQRAFKLLGIDGFDTKDRALARTLLNELATLSPALRERMQAMGSSLLDHDGRFVDTFLHTWEITKDLSQWFAAFEMAGLKPLGIYDRYAELDDLDNPLWQAPDISALTQRANDRRYENNLEIYLMKPGKAGASKKAERPSYRWQYLRMVRRNPPVGWFSYQETRGITLFTRRQLWWRFCQHLFFGKGQVDNLLRDLDQRSLKRLARLGAILPGQVQSASMRQTLQLPLCDSMAPPACFPTARFEETKVAELVKKILEEKRNRDPKFNVQVLKRLEAATR